MFDILWILLVISILGITSSAGYRPKGPVNVEPNYYGHNDMNNYGDCNGTLQNFLDAANSFSFKFLSYMIDTTDISQDKSSLPLNAFTLTCYLATYSYGQSWEEAKTFCGARTKKELWCALEVLRYKYYATDTPELIEYYYGLNVATNFNMTVPFIRKLKEITFATGRRYNFDKPTEVTRIINEMILKQTRGKVRNAITKPSIFRDDLFAKRMVFYSGVYFEAKWQTAFDAPSIIERDYYDLGNNRLRVPFLKQRTVYNYTYFADSDVISIPFVDGFFNCVVFVPKKRCGSKLFELLEKLKVPGVFKSITKRFRPACVNIMLPFYNDASTESDVGGALKSTGQLDSYFDPDMSQIRDSYGNNIDNFYLGAAGLKLVIRNTLCGAEPNYGCPDYLDVYNILADHPVIIVVEKYSVIRIITVGAVRNK